MFIQLLQYAEPTSLGWVFGLCLVLAIAMGFATGANDVANTFGTSVGSGALTLKKALIAASIFEVLGALALGSHVAGTLKSGIALYTCFEATPSLYMIGMTSALGAAASWLIFASVAGLPVSATHSIVGGIVGMAMALKGPSCVNWGMTGVGKIAVSWVTSPALSSLAAFGVFTLVSRCILHSRNSFQRALWSTPFLMAGTVLLLIMLTFWDIVKPWWGKLILCLGSPVLVFALTAIFGVPYLNNTITRSYQVPSSVKTSNGSFELQQIDTAETCQNGADGEIKLDGETEQKDNPEPTTPSSRQEEQVNLELDDIGRSQEHPKSLDGDNIADPAILESEKAKQVFWYLQNFTACLGSFAHGANDTANTIGPFAAVFHLWMDGTFDAGDKVPLWIVAIGGASIVLGLAILGHRVIKTLGSGITHVNYANGFSSELSSSITVVIASRLQIPVSSTHCQVGAIVGVGLVESGPNSRNSMEKQHAYEGNANIEDYTRANWRTRVKERLSHVEWKLIGKIFISWLVTVPISALVSAGFASILKNTV